MNKQKKSILSGLNDRDRRMLAILVIFILAFFSYYFVISPGLAEGALLKQEYISIKDELNKMEKMITDLPELRKSEAKQKKLLSEKYKAFFYSLDNEKILGQLNKLMIGNNFVISSYSVTEQTAEPIIIPETQYIPLTYPLLDLADTVYPDLVPGDPSDRKPIDEKGKENKKDKDTIAPDSVTNSFVTIGFNSTSYEPIKGFLNSLENMNKTIIIQNINVAQSLDGTGLQGEIILGFYSLPKLNDNESTQYEVKSSIPKGKTNPFN